MNNGWMLNLGIQTGGSDVFRAQRLKFGWLVLLIDTDKAIELSLGSYCFAVPLLCALWLAGDVWSFCICFQSGFSRYQLMFNGKL